MVLSIDSPGGVVDGCAQLAEKIRAARGAKPIHACINDVGASAAYLIASAADKISATKTARIGSIGVRAMHIDMSKALSDAGYTVTEIFAGDHKIDGTPYAPLSDAARAAIQASIDYYHGLFASTVAANRGLDKSAVIATQAAVYDPIQAKRLGLIDAIEDLSLIHIWYAEQLRFRDTTTTTKPPLRRLPLMVGCVQAMPDTLTTADI